MPAIKFTFAEALKFAIRAGLFVSLIGVGSLPFFSQEKKVKNETI